MSALSDSYQKIEDLMAQKFWLEAHRACLELLKLDPENIRVIRYKKKIEKEVRTLNKRAIQDDLENLKPLWKAGKYQEILDHLNKLLPYQSAFPSLDGLIKKAQKGLQIEERNKIETSFQQKKAAIEKLLDRQQFEMALQECNTLQALSADEKTQKFIRAVRNRCIDGMLALNQALLQSNTYDEIIAFYYHLLLIQPSTKLQKLLEAAKRQKRQSIIEEKRDFIYKGLDELRILYQLKKYQKALQAAQEILSIDPDNKPAKKWSLSTQKKLQQIADLQLIQQMKNQQEKLRDEYKQDRSQFTKI